MSHRHHVTMKHGRYRGRKGFLIKVPPLGYKSLSTRYHVRLLETKNQSETVIEVNRCMFSMNPGLSREQVWEIFGIDRSEDPPLTVKKWVAWAKGIMHELGYSPNRIRRSQTEYFPGRDRF